MMDALEQEVIEKFHQLDKAAQQRVREIILRETEPTAPFDYAAWWAEVDALQAAIKARIGSTGTVGALGLLDELREEAS
ncbi:MAG: hypothetical protein SNJ80_02950 [Anaerolinea sp.]